MPTRSRITLSRLELHNFKRFFGRHEVDLSPGAEGAKPIVLIGGDNGRGKTSLHEAIYYALYEDDDLPGINTRPSYLQAVTDRLNRRALDKGATDYAVTLELVSEDGGPERRFRIERRWEVDVPARKVVRAALTVWENGRQIDWLDSNNPHAVREFVRNIFPPRIAPFFFFDGERIQDFAESSNHERDLVEAIQDILHINIYKTLRNDLGKHVADHIEREEVRKVDSGDYFELQAEAERIENELEEKKSRKQELDREIGDLRTQQKAAEEELRRIASPHASKRDDLLADRERIEAELAQAKKDVDNGFEPLPIALSGTLSAKLKSTLEREARSIQTAAGLADLRRKLGMIARRVFYDPKPPPEPSTALSPSQIVFYEAAFHRAVEEAFDIRDGDRSSRLHDIGESERERILKRLDECGMRAHRLREAIDRRERLTSELRDVEAKLQSTSDDPAIAELIKRKQDLDEKVGQLENEANTLTPHIQELESKLAARKRQIAERQREREATSEAKRVVKLARNAQLVLDAFIKKLAPEKLKALEHHFNEMYSRVRKPEDPVRSVAVDPETWAVILKDERGRPLERRVFSAGMKEMYALSLLWALSRASGRELPMVIDTPLGRLDGKNRAALCRDYFPHAGHQVVVLSTDKEVDREWFEVLRPYVARQYCLDFDPTNDSTVVRPGYFF